MCKFGRACKGGEDYSKVKLINTKPSPVMSARWVDGPNSPLFCPERDSPGLPGALYNSDGAANEFGAPTVGPASVTNNRY